MDSAKKVNDVDHVNGLTVQQKAFVKNSWANQKDNMAELGVRIFITWVIKIVLDCVFNCKKNRHFLLYYYFHTFIILTSISKGNFLFSSFTRICCVLLKLLLQLCVAQLG